MTSGAPRTRKKSILRTTLIVLPAQVVFRGIEAFLPLLLAYWFGRSQATDVYNFVFAVFSLAGSLVFTAFQDSALIPILAEERVNHPAGMPRLLGSLLAHTWLLGGGVAIAVGGIAFASFAVRFDGTDFGLAAGMVLPFTIFLVALSTRTFFATLCSSNHEFFIQPVASCLGMVTNLTVLALYHDRTGVVLIPIGAVCGEIVATTVLAAYVIRGRGTKIRLCLDRPPALIRFARLVVSEIGGSTVTRLNPVVDQFMAGLAAVAGGGTILRYSGDVAMLPTSILQATLLPVLLSHLADDFATKDLVRIRRTVVKALGAVIGILAAATLLLWLVRSPLLRFIFLRGNMDEAGVERMISIFPYHLVGLAPFGALLVLARAHIAVKNSALMLPMGILNASCNAIFNVILLKAIGLEGIALSTSCVQAAVAIVFWIRFEKRLTDLRTGAVTA